MGKKQIHNDIIIFWKKMTYDEECPANLVEIKSRENKWIFLFIKIRLGAGLNCSAASEEIKIKYSTLGAPLHKRPLQRGGKSIQIKNQPKKAPKV